jgi:16S rRNA (cytosine967-C5)-methyltransferase
MLMADLFGRECCVVGAEASPRRLRSMAALCRRWGSPNIRLVLADGNHPPFARGFDAVLIDAPCSGLGTLGRHPDIRWRLTPDDIPRHAKRQRALLDALAPLVRRGGRLVYATCSLEEEETTGVVLDFLGNDPALRIADVPEWARPYAGSDGLVRTCPGREPVDGFFVAPLERA